MITKAERKLLETPSKGVGYDCFGKLLHQNDTVVVVREEHDREGNPDYEFCCKGKKGKVVEHIYGGNTAGTGACWVVLVQFPGGRVGCTDIYLQK